MSENNHPTGRQLAAARALAGLGQLEVAGSAQISLPTLRRMEASPGAVSGMPNNIAAVLRVLTAAGVEFIDDERGEGVVKLRAK